MSTDTTFTNKSLEITLHHWICSADFKPDPTGIDRKGETFWKGGKERFLEKQCKRALLRERGRCGVGSFHTSIK